MFKAKKAHIRILAAAALMALPAMVSAQSYYDDDIYYNVSKNKNKPRTQSQQPGTPDGVTVYSSKSGVYSPSVTVNFPGADTYYVNTGSTRDVDAYNRYGQFLVSDSISGDSLEVDQYSNTRRIERFHNSDIVNGLSEEQYAAYVSSNPTVVNVYVDNDPWGYPYYGGWRWRSPWYSASWCLYDPWIGIYDPWYRPGWGWGYYDWSWGWGPVWGPSWGPGWGGGWGHPGWGPGWGGPGWGPGWGGAVAHRPQTPSGSSRPHNYAGAGSSLRPVTTASSNRNPGMNSSSSRRPGNNGYGNNVGNGSSSNRYGQTSRPGSTGGSYNSAAGATSVPSTAPSTTSRGRNPQATQQSSGSYRQSTPSRSSSSSSTRSSSSSTRSSSSSYGSSSSSHSSGSYSSGRSSGGYSGGHGGGTHSSGGGGSRGGGGGRGR